MKLIKPNIISSIKSLLSSLLRIYLHFYKMVIACACAECSCAVAGAARRKRWCHRLNLNVIFRRLASRGCGKHYRLWSYQTHKTLFCTLSFYYAFVIRILFLITAIHWAFVFVYQAHVWVSRFVFKNRIYRKYLWETLNILTLHFKKILMKTNITKFHCATTYKA